MLTYGGKVVKTSAGFWVKAQHPVDPYNPLGLPQYTIRARFNAVPSGESGFSGTITHVSADVYDITTTTGDWSSLFGGYSSVPAKISRKPVEVLGANGSGVTDMARMFYDCTSLTTVPLFDTSNATSVASMFRGCTSLTTVPLFDTSNATSFGYMFYDCTSLTTVPLFDTSNATSVAFMFGECTSLTTVPLLNMSNVGDMEGMFYGCTRLTTVPLFDTSHVYSTMASMFSGCTSLTTVPLFDTSHVYSMASMFYGCTRLTTVPLFDTASVNIMRSMFNGCNSLTTVPLFDTRYVSTMWEMFSGCSRLASVPLFNTSNVLDMRSMFYGCTSLSAIPLFDTSSVTNINRAFLGCTSVSTGAYELYSQAATQTIPPSNHTDTFKNCGANEMIPINWGGLYIPGTDYTFEKYYYSSDSTDLAAFTPRNTTGYLSGAIWVLENGATLSAGSLFKITTPQTPKTMSLPKRSDFYKWNSSTTQSSSRDVNFGLFAVPKANLTRQNVYGNYYGWYSSSEPQLICRIESAGTAPLAQSTSSVYTPPANTTYTVSTGPTIPADSAILLCLYIQYDGNIYFGTRPTNTSRYLPYSSNNDLILRIE